MQCGWGCGDTGRNMRAHFTICAKRPAATGHGDLRGSWKQSRPLARRKSGSRGEFPLSDVLQNSARTTMTSLESPREYILEPRMTSTPSEEEEYAF
jgi:hypothetical protein